MNKLEQLKQFTTVVADTGDIEAIKLYQPQDATTNPSLILNAAQTDDGLRRVDQAVAKAKAKSDDWVSEACDDLAVSIGCDIQTIVPGYISTEVDARLSFDTEATLAQAYSLVERYAAGGGDTNRVLIKVASTWEGIQAARVLEKDGIKCNLTLLFGFEQAQACADAGAYLISPFVGRILDWYKAQQPDAELEGAADPGVQSVQAIWRHYKQHGYETVVMGASFRNTSEIEHLAGCDRLTIGPGLLQQLQDDQGTLERQLDPAAITVGDRVESISETAFRWGHNDNAMATEKLAEGIRKFAADQVKLESLIRSRG